jgi:signal transduction histidine kinase
VPLDLNRVIEEILPLVRHEVLTHEVLLRLDLAPSLPPIRGDRIQLQQVVINLMVNGIQAMESVTDRPRELTIRSHLDDSGHVVVAVQDCGVGIDPANATRLFNAFFTTKPSGMGMGLSISRSIINDHGGTLSASAHTGPGATFKFVLPAHQAAPA